MKAPISVVFYGSHLPPAATVMAYYKEMTARNIDSVLTARVWVRVELVFEDAAHALDAAKPKDGETVLNSMEIT